MNSKKLLEKRIDHFLDHLEFLGYELLREESDKLETYTASHPNKPELRIRLHKDVVAFHTYLPTKKSLMKDRATLQLFVNELNENSTFILSGLTEDNCLFFFSYYFGPYGKKEFGRFIDAINDDYFSTIESVDGWEKYFEMGDD